MFYDEAESSAILINFVEFSNKHKAIKFMTPFNRTLLIKKCKMSLDSDSLAEVFKDLFQK